jgi:hypothetical protein
MGGKSPQGGYFQYTQPAGKVSIFRPPLVKTGPSRNTPLPAACGLACRCPVSTGHGLPTNPYHRSLGRRRTSFRITACRTPSGLVSMAASSAAGDVVSVFTGDCDGVSVTRSFDARVPTS